MAVSWFQKFVRSLVKSAGLKRRLSAAFQTLALIIGQIPALVPFAGVLTAIAGWLGLIGFSHGMVSEEVRQKSESLVPLATIAAFFNALVLAADTVPQLTPFKGVFVFLASVFSAFSTATTVAAIASK